MDDARCPILSWNVRGKNMPAKRDAIREVVQSHRLAILCLQETKIDVWDRRLVLEIGGALLADCVVLPAIGTRGVAIFCNKALVSVTSHVIGQFTITAKVTVLQTALSFWLTIVYSPADDACTYKFRLELARASPPASDP